MSVSICKYCCTLKEHYITIILQLVPCVVLTIFTGILVKVLYQVGVLFFYTPVPEIIDPVFTKTSPKRSFSMTEYERFRLVFTKTRVYKFGHRSLVLVFEPCINCEFVALHGPIFISLSLYLNAISNLWRWVVLCFIFSLVSAVSSV